MFYSKIICSIFILEMQGAWFILSFSKLLILYPRLEKYTPGKEIRRDQGCFPNPQPCEVWGLEFKGHGVLGKVSFLFPRIQTSPSGQCMAGREAHWWNPSYYFVIIHLSLWTHWCYGLADPCCPPPPSWNDGICFLDDGPLKKICFWTVEIRLLMLNCVLMCDYLSTWHFFPLPEQNENNWNSF